MKRSILAAAAFALLTGHAAAATLYTNDFDGAETVGAGVGVTALTNGVLRGATADFGDWQGNYFLNDSFGNPAALSSLTLTNLAPHTQISAAFILGFLDSWDGFDGSCCAPDSLDFFVDGVKVASFTGNNAQPLAAEVFGGGTIIAHYVETSGNSGWTDTLVEMGTAPVMTFAHTGSTLTLALQASGTGWQGGSDESWGIDAIHITYDAQPVPEPSTWALMVAGVGLMGAATRRKKGVTRG